MNTLLVSEKCICCGICTQKTNLLVEDVVGKAKPADGCIVMDKDLSSIEVIAAECPVSAIKIVTKYEDNKLDVAVVKELPHILKVKLNALPKLKVTKNDIKMDAKKYAVHVQYPNGECRYNYSSESKALNAGLDEFDRIAYSQYRRIILDIFVQYREDKLKKYYTFDKGSFWGDANSKYEKALLEFANEVKGLFNGKIVLPKKFTEFKAIPGGDTNLRENFYLYILANFDELSTQSGIMAEFNGSSYHRKNDYKSYIDTDYIEEYKGESFWGNPKYSTKYCYRRVYEAVKEYLSDLQLCINYVDVDERPLDKIEDAIESYYKEVEKIVENKIQMLQKAIKNSGL